MKRHVLLGTLLWLAAVQNPKPGYTESEDSAFRPTVEFYQITEGDTLWGISEKFLGDPFLWPRVWALNPEITNPHWIYPGDTLRFTPASTDLLSRADLFGEPIEETEAYEKEETKKTVAEPQTAPPPLSRRLAARPPTRFLEYIIMPQKLTNAAELTNASPDSIFLSKGSNIYLDFKDEDKPPSEAKLISYQPQTEIFHPLTGDFAGYLTKITGLVEMNNPSSPNPTSNARIVHAVSEIERGQFATVVDNLPILQMVRVEASAKVEGIVVSTERVAGLIIGAGSYVFIDKGSEHGLQRGNQIRLFSDRTDQLSISDDLNHEIHLGVAQIVDVRSTSSTCIVLKSAQEIERGASFTTIVKPNPNQKS